MLKLPCKRSHDDVPKSPSNVHSNQIGTEDAVTESTSSQVGTEIYRDIKEDAVTESTGSQVGTEIYRGVEEDATESTASFQGNCEEQEHLVCINEEHIDNAKDVVDSMENIIDDSLPTEITWLLDEKNYISSNFLSCMNLHNQNFPPEFISLYFKELWSHIIHKNGESKFYLAQENLREIPFKYHIAPKLEFIISLLKDDSRHDEFEAVLLLHSICSLLHNNTLHSGFMDNLMNALVFSLINPISRYNFGSHCYLLKDIIADIIVILFEKYAKKVWNETIVKLRCAFEGDSSFVVLYGAIALALSSKDFIREVSPSLKDNLIIFLNAQKNTPSKQIALNVKNKLQILLKCWIELWLCSSDRDCSEDMKVLSPPDFYVSDFLYCFCKDDLFQYSILPSKYMCHRISPKTNKIPFSSLFSLVVPSKKKLDTISEKNLIDGVRMSIKQEEEEDPFMSRWSDKTLMVNVSSWRVAIDKMSEITEKSSDEEDEEDSVVSQHSDDTDIKNQSSESDVDDFSSEQSNDTETSYELPPEEKPSIGFNHVSVASFKLKVTVTPIGKVDSSHETTGLFLDGTPNFPVLCDI